MNDEWQSIETLPPVKQDLILCWLYENGETEMRFGRLLYKPIIEGDPPIFRLDLAYGDADTTIYTKKDDPPTHWRPKPDAPTHTEAE